MNRENIRRYWEQAPFNIMAKPAGPQCNLRCEHCFYLHKLDLFQDSESLRMNSTVLEQFVKQYIEAQPPGTRTISFGWQGGEPTLMGLDFFRQAVELQKKHAPPGVTLSNSLQTNGTLLDDEWAEFLHENQFLVGISIDGPPELHDKYRLDARGGGSFEASMRGLEALKRHRVEFNTLTCVQSHNADYPERIYDFLKKSGSRFFQFIPIVETDSEGNLTSRSVGPKQYGRFLCGIFDRWLSEEDVGRVFIRDFDNFIALMMGYPAGVCVHAEVCGKGLIIEHNGDIFSCDHFVTPAHRLGNVQERTLSEMVCTDRQWEFGYSKKNALPAKCLECRYLSLCNGGCLKDRLIETEESGKPLNHLCEGYRHFFRHALPVFEKMVRCLQAKRPACDYKVIDEPVLSKPSSNHKRAGRNDPCPCGSGKKYKKCCGAV